MLCSVILCFIGIYLILFGGKVLLTCVHKICYLLAFFSSSVFGFDIGLALVSQNKWDSFFLLLYCGTDCSELMSFSSSEVGRVHHETLWA